MKKYFVIVCFAMGVLTACNNNPVGDDSLVEGAWQLDKIVADGQVSYDNRGEGHYTAGEHTDTYANKELVWLLYQNHQTMWMYSEKYKMWDAYIGDCEVRYSIETTGDKKYLVTISRSTIPYDMPQRITTHHNEMPFPSSRYEITRLNKNNMVLDTDGAYMLSSDMTSQLVHLTYYFTRENTLLKFIKEYEALENNRE